MFENDNLIVESPLSKILFKYLSEKDLLLEARVSNTHRAAALCELRSRINTAQNHLNKAKNPKPPKEVEPHAVLSENLKMVKLRLITKDKNYNSFLELDELLKPKELKADCKTIEEDFGKKLFSIYTKRSHCAERYYAVTNEAEAQEYKKQYNDLNEEIKKISSSFDALKSFNETAKSGGYTDLIIRPLIQSDQPQKHINILGVKEIDDIHNVHHCFSYCRLEGLSFSNMAFCDPKIFDYAEVKNCYFDDTTSIDLRCLAHSDNAETFLKECDYEANSVKGFIALGLVGGDHILGLYRSIEHSIEHCFSLELDKVRLERKNEQLGQEKEQLRSELAAEKQQVAHWEAKATIVRESLEEQLAKTNEALATEKEKVAHLEEQLKTLQCSKEQATTSTSNNPFAEASNLLKKSDISFSLKKIRETSTSIFSPQRIKLPGEEPEPKKSKQKKEKLTS